MRRRFLRIISAVGLLLLVGLAALHLAPARNYARQRAEQFLRDRAGIDARIGALDYSLPRLRFDLRDVRLAPAWRPETPFFEATHVTVELFGFPLLAPVRLGPVTVDGAKVTIARDAQGQYNLPRRRGTGPSPPPSRTWTVPDSLELRRLAFLYRDDRNGFSVSLSGARWSARQNLRGLEGTLSVEGDTRLRWPQRSLALTDFQTHVRWTGTDVYTTGVRATIYDGSGHDGTPASRAASIGAARPSTALTTLSGELAWTKVFESSAVAGHAEGILSTEPLARWFDVPLQSAGTARWSATLDGPPAALVVNASVLGRGLTLRRVRFDTTTAQLRAHFGEGRLTVEQSELHPATGGVIAATARLPIGSTPEESVLQATWRATTLATALTAGGIEPIPGIDAALDGTLSARWRGGVAASLVATVDNAMRPGPSSGVPLNGRAKVIAAGGRYRLEHDHTLGPLAVSGSAGGTLETLDVSRAGLAGPLDARTDDLPALLRQLSGATFISRTVAEAVTTGAVAFSGRLEGTLGAPRVTGAVEARNVRVGPDLPIDFSAPVTVTASRVAITPGALVVGGNRVEAGGTVGLPRGTLDVDARGPLTDFAPIWRAFDLPATWEPRGTVQTTARVTGRLAEPIVEASVSGSLAVRGLEDLQTDAQLVLAERRLTVEHVRVATGAGTIEGDGGFDFSAPARPYHARVAVALREAERLAPLVAPTAWPVTGQWVARAASDGTFADLAAASVEGLIERIDGTVRGVPVTLEEPAHVSREGDRITATRVVLHSRDTTVEIDGALGPGEPGLRLVSDLHLADLEPWLADLRDERRPTLAGLVRVDLLARGRLRRPTLSGRVAGHDLVVALPDGHVARDLSIDATVDHGRLNIARLTGTWLDATIDVIATTPVRLFEPWLPAAWAGSLETSDAPARIDAAVRNLTPSALAPFVDPATLASLGGRVSATLSLQAPRLTRDAWQGELVLDEAEVSIAQVPVRQETKTRLLISDSQLRVEAWQWTGPGTTITAAGGLSWKTDQVRLDAAVDANVDLRMASAFVRPSATAGSADVSVSLAGPVTAPIIEGRVLLANAEYRMRDPRIAVTDVKGTILLVGERVWLEQIRGAVNGGTLAIDGTAQLHAWHLEAMAVTIAANNAAVEFPTGLRTEIVADLKLTRPRDAGAAVLGGTITAIRGSYREQLGLVSQLLSGGTRPTVEPVQPKAAPTVLDALRLDIGLATLEDITVDMNYGRLEAGGSLRLQGTAGTPTLTGRIALRQGGQVFLGGTTYRIESGSVDFRGGPRLRPQLDIVATTQVSSYRITLDISGTPDRVRADLTSDPPLDRTNIVSLLVTGRTVSQGGLTTEVVGEQVLGYLSGDILNLAGRALGLDSVRIDRGFSLEDLRFDPTIIAGETDPSSRLTITKNLTREVEVVLSQNLKGNGAITWVATYRPRRAIAFRILSLDDTERTYEFRQELSFGGTPPAPERPERSGPRISAVTFSGPDVVPSTLLDVVRLGPGRHFDFYRWQDDRERLLRYYHDQARYEADVSARRQETTGEDGAPAVALSYEIRPGPRGELVVNGVTFDPGTLAEMRTEWTRTVFDDFLIEDLTRIARTALVRDGYLRSAIRTRIETRGAAPQAVKTITVDVTPGPRTATRRIDWTGNSGLSRDQLDAAIADAGLQSRIWEDPSALEAPIRDLYATHGYLHATVTAHDPTFDGDTAQLRVRIAEGVQAQLATVVLRGVRAIPLSQLAQASRLTAGELLQPSDLERARRIIERRYYDRGFSSAKVDVQATSRADGRVDVLVDVEEGPQQILSRIEVVGAPNANRGLVTSALKLHVDEPLSQDAFYEARRRLYETGAFRQVDVQTDPAGPPVPGETPGVMEQPVSARLTLQEWPLWRFRYGLQVNDIPLPDQGTRDVGPGFSTDLERSNLFGRAARIGVALRYDDTRQAVRTYFSTPRLFKLPVTSTLFAQQEWEQEGDADSQITRITFEQRYRVQRTTQLNYGYFYRHTRVPTVLDVLGDPIPIDLIVNYAGLYAAVSLDRRNDPFDPRRGWFHGSSVQYAAQILGSDARFIKTVFQQAYYRPLRRGVVFASNARLGLADGFGQDLIEDERFFAGGGNTVRGYREDTLSPRTSTGFLVGGEALVVLNEELRYPIWRWMRGVAFVDAGRAFLEPTRIRLDELDVGAGIGLRLSTPVGVLRFDFGIPVTQGGGLGAGRWHFSFGQVF